MTRETKHRITLCAAGVLAAAVILAACGGNPPEMPDGSTTCTLTTAETSGVASITSATPSAPACADEAAQLVGQPLQVTGGNVAAGIPFELTDVRSYAGPGSGCTYALTGRAVLPSSVDGCLVVASLALQVVR